MKPRSKAALIWSLSMGVPIIVIAALMYVDKLNQIVGGVLFILLMAIMMYGDYRIDKKYRTKEAKTDGF